MSALVALHGFAGEGADWSAALRGWGARCPDLPGHGWGPALSGEGWAMPQVVDWLDARRPRGAWWLIGYSMGGRVALHWALRRPAGLRGLVLVSATAGLEGAERVARVLADRALADRVEAEGVGAFAAWWETQPLLATQARAPAAWLRARAGRRARASAAGWAASLRGYGAGAMDPVWSELRGLQLPALVVHGEEDAKFAALAERLVAELPEASRLSVPSAGHAAPWEAGRAFRAGLARWARAEGLVRP